ncbi:MAG: hypothetical protein KJZ53_09345 [Anaerolineales bacterium]|nr:hypothetical protein [Anaerolineales bacterium]MCL4258716.1 hypothetical protein [Anaerolineales bacterium]QYK49938.1 MAG: hypothetical protein KF701_05945 [Anaerolineales bacterium]
MDFVVRLHEGLGSTSLYYFLILSVWGYVRFFRKQGIDSSFWGMLVIAEILVILQCILGAYLWLEGSRPMRSIHVLYGIILPLMIPAAYLYTKGRSSRAEILIYATATIITVGLIVRAIYTAQVALPG